jgi:hypothetical protein
VPSITTLMQEYGIARNTARHALAVLAAAAGYPDRPPPAAVEIAGKWSATLPDAKRTSAPSGRGRDLVVNTNVGR